MLSESKQQMIQKFLSNGLTAEENNTFKEHLEDSEFKQELVFQTEVLKNVSEFRRNKIKAIVTDQQSIPSVDPKNSMLTKWLIGILVLILFSVIASMLIKQKSISQSQQIYAEFYSPYPAEKNKRGSQVVNWSEQYEMALSDYAAEKYDKASEKFMSILSEQQKTNLYLGICHLELNNTSEAEAIFLELIRSDSTKLKQQAEWYLAMNYLKSNKVEKANLIIQNISTDESHIYFDKAKVVRRSMD